MEVYSRLVASSGLRSVGCMPILYIAQVNGQLIDTSPIPTYASPDDWNGISVSPGATHSDNRISSLSRVLSLNTN